MLQHPSFFEQAPVAIVMSKCDVVRAATTTHTCAAAAHRITHAWGHECATPSYTLLQTSIDSQLLFERLIAPALDIPMSTEDAERPMNVLSGVSPAGHPWRIFSVSAVRDVDVIEPLQWAINELRRHRS